MFRPHFVAAPSAAAPAWTAALTVDSSMAISFLRRFFALAYYSLGSALDANGI